MPKSRLLDVDWIGETQEVFHPADDGRGSFTLETVQNLQPILEQNRRIRNEYTSLDRWNDGDRVAQIPLVVWMEMQKQGIVGRGFKILDRKRFNAWLNDPDNEMFRTRRGRI